MPNDYPSFQFKHYISAKKKTIVGTTLENFKTLPTMRDEAQV
jgi:hypothetical protein